MTIADYQLAFAVRRLSIDALKHEYRKRGYIVRKIFKKPGYHLRPNNDDVPRDIMYVEYEHPDRSLITHSLRQLRNTLLDSMASEKGLDHPLWVLPRMRETSKGILSRLTGEAWINLVTVNETKIRSE